MRVQRRDGALESRQCHGQHVLAGDGGDGDDAAAPVLQDRRRPGFSADHGSGALAAAALPGRCAADEPPVPHLQRRAGLQRARRAARVHAGCGAAGLCRNETRKTESLRSKRTPVLETCDSGDKLHPAECLPHERGSDEVHRG